MSREGQLFNKVCDSLGAHILEDVDLLTHALNGLFKAIVPKLAPFPEERVFLNAAAEARFEDPCHLIL